MNVSVCIVNWNTKDLLRKCIRSIKDKTTGIMYEIIVVDNGSRDGSVEMLYEEFPDCILIEPNENLGFARGNNLAVKYAKGKYILFLNPDTELITNALHGMYIYLETSPTAGAAGCKLIYPDGIIQYTCASTFPTPFRELSYLLFLNRLFPKSHYFSARELDFWDHEDSREVDCLSGACIMARRDLFEKLGGFDEKLFMYGEDLDLCYRILKEGFHLYYLSKEVIIHYEGASSQKQEHAYFTTILTKESNYYFMLKNYGWISAKCYRGVIFTGSLFRIVITALLFPASYCGLLKGDVDPHHILNKYRNTLLWSIHLKRISV